MYNAAESEYNGLAIRWAMEGTINNMGKNKYCIKQMSKELMRVFVTVGNQLAQKQRLHAGYSFLSRGEKHCYYIYEIHT